MDIYLEWYKESQYDTWVEKDLMLKMKPDSVDYEYISENIDLNEFFKILSEDEEKALEYLSKNEINKFSIREKNLIFKRAIYLDKRLIIDYLIDNLKDLNFCSKLDKKTFNTDQKHFWSFIYKNEEFEKDLIYNEFMLAKIFGVEHDFGRTPFSIACRYNHQYTIEKLLKKKVKTGVKDFIGNTELEYCIRFKDIKESEKYLNIFIDNKSYKGITEKVLEKFIFDKNLVDYIFQKCKLSKKLLIYLFNLKCSILDFDFVEEMLKNGFNPNDAIRVDENPLEEVMTSEMIYNLKYWRPVLVDVWEGLPKARSTKDSGKPEYRTNNLDIRVKMVDLLYEYGLDNKILEKRSMKSFISHLIDTGKVELFEALFSHGLNVKVQREDIFSLNDKFVDLFFAIKKKYKTKKKSKFAKYEFFWDVESKFTIKILKKIQSEEKFKIEFVHENGFGPDEGLVKYFIQIIDKKTKNSVTDWLEFKRVSETIEYDGDIVEIKKMSKIIDLVDEEYYMENEGVPWCGKFSKEFSLPKGRYIAKIKIVSEDELSDLVLSGVLKPIDIKVD